VQVPRRAGSLQETHCPWQAELQQTPSAQKPELQSALAVHEPPGGRFPQLPVESQTCASHWVLEVHLSKQVPLLASHENGVQRMVGPDRQLPVPSQTLEPTIAAPWQVPEPQAVPITALRQLPAPLQVPSRPQGSDRVALQSDAWRGASPLARPPQTPSEPLRAQVLHPELQDSLQQ